MDRARVAFRVWPLLRRVGAPVGVLDRALELGAALGGMTGPGAVVASPAPAALGSVKGQELAEDLYDDHHEALRKKAEDATRWMKDRQPDVHANPSRMMAPYWQVDDLTRARRR